jgi:hypothetical protein
VVGNRWAAVPHGDGHGLRGGGARHAYGRRFARIMLQDMLHGVLDDVSKSPGQERQIGTDAGIKGRRFEQDSDLRAKRRSFSFSRSPI